MSKKATINFQKEYKLWKACAKEDSFRPVLEYVFFKDGYAYASDAHILVRVPLDLCTTFSEGSIELLDGYAIHWSVLKGIVKYDNVQVAQESVKRNGVDKLLTVLIVNNGDNFIKIYLSDNMSVTPPDFSKLLVTPDDATSIMRIGMYADRQSAIAEALGTKMLKMRFTKETDRVFVTPVDETNDSIGIIMPFIID